MPSLTQVRQTLFGANTNVFSWRDFIEEVSSSPTPIEVLIARWVEVSRYMEKHHQELDELVNQLLMMENNHLTPETRGVVTAELRIVDYYLRCRLKPVEHPLAPLVLNELFPQEVLPQAHYQQIIQSLFEKDFPPLFDAESAEKKAVFCSDFDEFSNKVKLLEKMIRLIPPQGEQTPVQTLIVEVGLGLQIKHALVSLLNAIRRILKLNVKPTDEKYLDTGDKLWRITQRFNLYFEHREDEQAGLIDWYKQAADYYEGQSYFHEKRTQDKSLWPIDALGKLSAESMVNSVGESLEEDLERIAKWSRSEARAELMEAFLQQQKEQGMNHPVMTKAVGCVYAAVYQKMEERIQTWSQHAWEIRKFYEIKLRSHKNYRELVKKLDKTLLDLIKGSYSKKAQYRAEIEQLFEDDFFARANNCFAELDNSCIGQLRDANWIHHTAYAAGETEGYLALEMNAWMRAKLVGCFDEYRLDYTWTMTDYVAEQLHGIWREIKARAALALHPDKAESEAERVVRDICFKQLQVWLSHAAAMRETWASGQWIAAAPGDALRIEGGNVAASDTPAHISAAEEGFRVSKPIDPLDLSVLQLKEAYTKKLESNSSQGIDARKRTCEEIPVWRQLHTGNEEDREFYEQSTQYETFVRQAAEEQRRSLAELEAMKNAAQQRLKEAIRQKEEAIREATRQADEAVRQATHRADEATHRAEEAMRQNRVASEIMITTLLSVKLSAACFQCVSADERKAFYERGYAEVLATMRLAFVQTIPAVEQDILHQLRTPEYNHLRGLVPVETQADAAVSGVGQNRFAMYSSRELGRDDSSTPSLGRGGK
jgi:hypothetical protein